MRGYFLLLLLFFGLWESVSSVCIPFEGAVAPTFAGLIIEGTPVYVESLEKAEESARAFVVGFNTITNGQCRTSWAHAIANTLFPSCQSPTSGYPVCTNLCTAIEASCPNSDELTLISVMFDADILQSYITGDFTKVINCARSTFFDGGTTGKSASGVQLCSSVERFQKPLPSNAPTGYYSAVPFQYGRCSAYTGTVCKGVAAPFVFVDSFQTFAALEKSLSNFPALLSGVSPSCAASASYFICKRWFPDCDNSTALSTASQFIADNYRITLPFAPAPLPRYPSKSSCLSMQKGCGMRVTGGNATIADIFIPAFPPEGPLTNDADIKPIVNVAVDAGKLALLGYRYPINCNEINGQSGLPYFVDGPTVWRSAIPGLATPLLITIDALPTPSPSSLISLTPYQLPFNSLLFKQESFNVTSDVKRKLLFHTGLSAPASKSHLFTEAQAKAEDLRSFCEGIIPEGESIYLAAGSSLESLNQQIKKFAWIFPLFPSDSTCLPVFVQHICWRVFRAAERKLIDISLVTVPGFPSVMTQTPVLTQLNLLVPRQPCLSVCTDMLSKCQSFFTNSNFFANLIPLLNEPLLSCDDADEFPSQNKVFSNLQFPGPLSVAFGLPQPVQAALPRQLSVPFTNGAGAVVSSPVLPFTRVVTVLCKGRSSGVLNQQNGSLPLPAASFLSLAVQCPWPTAKTDGAQSTVVFGTPCALLCPVPVFEEDDLWFFHNAFGLSSYLSILCMVFILISWLFFKRKQKQVRYFLVCVFLVSIVNSVVYTSGERRVCVSPTETANMDSSNDGAMFCVLQGAALHFLGLASVFWWTAQAVDLYLVLVCQISPDKHDKAQKFYHLVVWTVPSGLVGIAWWVHAYGSYLSIEFCFLFQFEWTLYYAPLILSLLIGFFCMGKVIKEVVRSNKALNKSMDRDSMMERTEARKSTWNKIARPLLFLALFFILFSTIATYRLYIFMVASKLEDAIDKWVTCFLYQMPLALHLAPELGVDLGLKTCPRLPDTTPSFWGYVITLFAWGGQGLFVFLLYGTSTDLYVAWIKKCKLSRNNCCCRFIICFCGGDCFHNKYKPHAANDSRGPNITPYDNYDDDDDRDYKDSRPHGSESTINQRQSTNDGPRKNGSIKLDTRKSSAYLVADLSMSRLDPKTSLGFDDSGDRSRVSASTLPASAVQGGEKSLVPGDKNKAEKSSTFGVRLFGGKGNKSPAPAAAPEPVSPRQSYQEDYDNDDGDDAEPVPTLSLATRQGQSLRVPGPSVPPRAADRKPSVSLGPTEVESIRVPMVVPTLLSGKPVIPVIFPRELEEDGPDASLPPPAPAVVAYLEALFDCVAASPEELSFKKGDRIDILKEEEDGWYDGLLNGAVGFVPSNYVNRIGPS